MKGTNNAPIFNDKITCRKIKSLQKILNTLSVKILSIKSDEKIVRRRNFLPTNTRIPYFKGSGHSEKSILTFDNKTFIFCPETYPSKENLIKSYFHQFP